MNRINWILLLSLLFLAPHVHGATLIGTVQDESTGARLPYANAVLEGEGRPLGALAALPGLR